MKRIKTFILSPILSLIITSLMTAANFLFGKTGDLPFPLYQDRSVMDAIIWHGVGVEQFRSAWIEAGQPQAQSEISFNPTTFLTTWAQLCLIFIGLMLVYYVIKKAINKNKTA